MLVPYVPAASRRPDADHVRLSTITLTATVRVSGSAQPRRTFLMQREFQPPMYTHWPSAEMATPLAVLICVPGSVTQPSAGDHSSTPPVSAPAIASSTLTSLRPSGS